MKQRLISLHGQTVELRVPSSILEDIELLFRDTIAGPGLPGARIVIEEADDRFSIATNDVVMESSIKREPILAAAMEAVTHALIKDLGSAVALHAGSVAHKGAAVMLAGPTGSGKSSLVTWLAGNGFGYLSDEITLLSVEDGRVEGFARAPVLKPGALEPLLSMKCYRGAASVASGDQVMLRLPRCHPEKGTKHPCRLIVFPQFSPGAELQITPLSSAQSALQLIGNNVNARNLGDGGFHAIAGLARTTPAVKLTYGDFSQLEGRFDVLLRLLLDEPLDAEAGRRFLSLLAPRNVSVSAPPTTPRKYEIPAATPRREPRKLTIGMATYDDYDGVYFSLQALRLYHPEILAETDFLLIDNHPDGPCAAPLKMLENSIPNFRYVPFHAHSGTAVRDRIFVEADGDFVLCMDSHVFLLPGAVRRLIDYLDGEPATNDLLQGPLVYDDLDSISTHFHPVWRAGMYGYWETDERGKDPDAAPFEIPMQGLGVFACRRRAWPGLNPAFRGFGGEEGYLHEKFRQRGGRTLCLPFLRWVHRFQRPLGIPYLNSWEDRIRNYMIGFRELGLPTDELEQHYRELLGSVAAVALDRIGSELRRGQPGS